MNAQEVAEICYFHYGISTSRAFLEGLRYGWTAPESFEDFRQNVEAWVRHLKANPEYEFQFVKK